MRLLRAASSAAAATSSSPRFRVGLPPPPPRHAAAAPTPPHVRSSATRHSMPANSCCAPASATAASNAGAGCCGPAKEQTPAQQQQQQPAAAAVAATAELSAQGVKDTVQQYYGTELKTSDDLKTSACKACTPPPPQIRQLLKELPNEVVEKFYGCGTPLPLGTTGLRVLDLGSGSGRDCYVAARLVGESGFVTGVDMTPEQLDVANRNLDAYTRDVCKFSKPNMKFVRGEIEYLDKAGIPDASQDIVISNCVINLSPDKPRVLSEVYRVLAAGGEMYFSDVYCDRRLTPEVRNHPVMIGECLGGALYVNDFLRICRKVGFSDPRYLSVDPLTVDDAELAKVAGDAKFYSITFRLFKLPEGELEDGAEDYGHEAIYKGSLPGSLQSYTLDDGSTLLTGVPQRVDANTAAILAGSWLAPHFMVLGDRSIHRGAFPRATPSLDERCAASAAVVAAAVGGGGGCCGPEDATTAVAAGNGCCGPAEEAPKAATAGGGCCGPAKEEPKAAAAGGGCCGPAKEAPAPKATASGCKPSSGCC